MGLPILLLLTILLFEFFFGISKLSVSKIYQSDLIDLKIMTPEIILDDNSEFTNRSQSIFNKIKSLNKMLRGKKPIYITESGTQINVDPIGEEKSIKIIKNF